MTTCYKTPQVLIDAQNNWPEDEASIQADHFKSSNEDYPQEAVQNEASLRKDCARMEKFFAAETDAADLIARFRAEIFKQTGITL